METTFTPWSSLFGGILIGISATTLMLLAGRIMGVTGILTGLLFPASRSELAWRVALLAGMLTGPLLVLVASGAMLPIQVPTSTPMMALGGLVVGFGVSLGNGCTSGHGVCGIARGSARSVVATATFMATAFATVYLVRHVIGH